jgi:hypothetical protein
MMRLTVLIGENSGLYLSHFLWRIATKSLRFHMKMRRRGMDVNARCPMCFRLNEDGGHIFYKCKMVKTKSGELLI